jgi:hypothetical protein
MAKVCYQIWVTKCSCIPISHSLCRIARSCRRTTLGGTITEPGWHRAIRALFFVTTCRVTCRHEAAISSLY